MFNVKKDCRITIEDTEFLELMAEIRCIKKVYLMRLTIQESYSIPFNSIQYIGQEINEQVHVFSHTHTNEQTNKGKNVSIHKNNGKHTSLSCTYLRNIDFCFTIAKS